MTDQNQPDEFDERLATLAQSYHEPPPVPRDEIWARIEAARRRPPRVLPFRRVVRIVLPAAAVLALGVALGRMSAPPASPADTSSALVASPMAAPSAQDQALFRTVATQHLQQAGAFFELFRTAAESGRGAELAPAAARELLMSNRLLLASPAAGDEPLRALLEDVEFILAQIAQLPVEGPRADASLITDGMSAGDVVTRINSAVETSRAAVTPQGVL